MNADDRAHAFDVFHPGVAAAYFIGALLLAMTAFEPILVTIALASGFAYSCCVRGVRLALKSMRWQLPMVIIIALLNMLFSGTGRTELFRIGVRAFYLESFEYGLCMGVLLIETLLWFSNTAHVLTSDKVMALIGNAAPSLTLTISMAIRLVPDLVKRGREISAVQVACTAANPQAGALSADASGKLSLGDRVRQMTVLMGWSMENSLETADAMRSRAWGTAEKRTTYQRYRFRATDGVATAIIVALGALSCWITWSICANFSFYPIMSPLAPWWEYLPVALFFFVPLVLEASEALRWR